MPGAKTRAFKVSRLSPAAYLVDDVALVLTSQEGYVVCDRSGRACWPALPAGVRNAPLEDYFAGFSKRMMESFRRAFEPVIRAAQPLLDLQEEAEVELPDTPAARFAAAILTHLRKYGTLSLMETLI